MKALGRAVRAAALCAAIGPAAAPTAGAQDLVPGMFVGTPDGPQELAVYAERSSFGRMNAPRASLDDVQRVAGAVRLICNLPTWRLGRVWLSTARVFTDDAAERRTLATVQRRLSISAVLVRVVPSEEPVRWRRLLADVGASPDNPAYLFVTMESHGMLRDFMVGIIPESPSPR